MIEKYNVAFWHITGLIMEGKIYALYANCMQIVGKITKIKELQNNV